MDALRLSVDWSRQEANGAGELVPVAGDSRVVTLREGQSHALDFILPPDGDRSCGQGLRVDLAPEVKEDPQFAGVRLDHDLWLVDEAPGRSPVTRHLALSSEQGRSLGFELGPLTWPVEGVRFDDGRPAVVAARVKGSLRARLRRDGVVDVVLDAQRSIGLGTGSLDEAGCVSDGGRKVVRLRAGETVSLLLPEVRGEQTVARDRSWGSVAGAPGMTSKSMAIAPVQSTADSITIDFGRFLADHRLCLRLTTGPAEP